MVSDRVSRLHEERLNDPANRQICGGGEALCRGKYTPYDKAKQRRIKVCVSHTRALSDHTGVIKLSQTAYNVPVRNMPYALENRASHIANGMQLLIGVADYGTLLAALNLSSAYRPSSLPYSLETHGSHTVNGVQLIPGAPGYDPQIAYQQWMSLLTVAAPAPVPEPVPEPVPTPVPTISVASSAMGFTVSLNVAGTVKMSVSGDLGSFAAGDSLLTEQATIKEGLLTLSSNGSTSTPTSQYVALGTAGNDSIDTSAAGNQADYIFGGAGNDTLKAGAGDDVIVGGSGNDAITGGEGADQLTGGAGTDVFIYTARDESYYSGAGTPLDTIGDFATGTDKIRFSLSGSAVDASNFSTVGNFVDGQSNSIAYSTVDKALYVSATGTSLNNTTAGAYVVSSIHAIDAGDLEFVIAGTGAADVLKGGVGNDIITGGDGKDSLSGGNGNDLFWYTDNVQLRADTAVAGGDGIDTIAFSRAINTVPGGSGQGANFHVDFGKATGIERIELSGSSHVNLGDTQSLMGLTTIVTGDDNTTLRYDSETLALGTLNVDASAMADNKVLTLKPWAMIPGTLFNVTGLKGDVYAAKLKGGIVVAAAAGTGFDVSLVGGFGADTLTGGAGNDKITGDGGADVLTGGLGADTFDVAASRYDSLDIIQDFDNTQDVLNLGIEVYKQGFGVVGNQRNVNTAPSGDSSGTTAASLAADLAAAVAQMTQEKGVASWKDAGDTMMVRILGASVAGNDVLYIVLNQANDSTFDAASEMVVALAGVSTIPNDSADFVNHP